MSCEGYHVTLGLLGQQVETAVVTLVSRMERIRDRRETTMSVALERRGEGAREREESPCCPQGVQGWTGPGDYPAKPATKQSGRVESLRLLLVSGLVSPISSSCAVVPSTGITMVHIT